MIDAIHHFVIAVADIVEARRDYERLFGRAADAAFSHDGADCVWFSTANVCVALIAPAKALSEGNALGEETRARLRTHGDGLWSMAFSVSDLARARRLALRRALAPTDVTPTLICADNAAMLVDSFTIDPALSAGLRIVFVACLPLVSAHGRADAASGLDHIVIRSANPGRAVELYGGRLGLNLRLDRSNPAWGARLLFFRCGDLIVEIACDLQAPLSDAPDGFGGFSWRTSDLAALRLRLLDEGFDLSEQRKGRRPGSHVCTIRRGLADVPTILLGLDKADGGRDP